MSGEFEYKALFEELSSLKMHKPFVPFAVKMKSGGRRDVTDWLQLLKWSDVSGFEVLKPAQA